MQGPQGHPPSEAGRLLAPRCPASGLAVSSRHPSVYRGVVPDAASGATWLSPGGSVPAFPLRTRPSVLGSGPLLLQSEDVRKCDLIATVIVIRPARALFLSKAAVTGAGGEDFLPPVCGGGGGTIQVHLLLMARDSAPALGMYCGCGDFLEGWARTIKCRNRKRTPPPQRRTDEEGCDGETNVLRGLMLLLEEDKKRVLPS